MKKEFTATVYIVHEDKVLLHFHPKLQKWLPPGGHIELNETPVAAARREVLEETGLEIEFITQENIWIKELNANSLERPYLCLLEEIPATGNVPAHQHMDMIYIAKPIFSNNWIIPSNPPTNWFGLEDLKKLEPHIDIFNDTLNIIQHILNTIASNSELIKV